MSNPAAAIWPSTPQNIEDFRRRVQAPYDDKPIVLMDDTTARNMDIIWRTFQDLATRWKGHQAMVFPGMPTDRKKFWAFFAQDHRPKPLPMFEEFVAKHEGKGKLAIDLGCGNSPAVRPLLGKGWRVLGVDSSKASLDVLAAQNAEAIASGQLVLQESDVADFVPKEAADLVLAADIFPYVDPARFQETWKKIHDTCVKEEGFLVGTFFRAPVRKDQEPEANIFKEMGAWLLPDRRMVRALLNQTGYEVETCKFRLEGDKDPDPMCIQFIAKKNSTKS